ncbi:MAG: DUF4124 domain-containing protein [Pseudomonadota bacterium]
MRLQLLVTVLLCIGAATAAAEGRHYKWVDADGKIYFGDSVPPEFTDLQKEVLNEQGVVVQTLAGKISDEELEAMRIAEEQRQAAELQERADSALLATYLTVQEIEMHRDRRVELFKAQSRVTELYLRNLKRQLGKLEREASRFQPYSEDPEAPMVDPSLVERIAETESIIARHEGNLSQFREDERQIIARFEGDIDRFKRLKNLE